LHARVCVVFLADGVVGCAVDVHAQEITVVLLIPSYQIGIAIRAIEIAIGEIRAEDPIKISRISEVQRFLAAAIHRHRIAVGISQNPFRMVCVNPVIVGMSLEVAVCLIDGAQAKML
jgi:hypothetical protein